MSVAVVRAACHVALLHAALVALCVLFRTLVDRQPESNLQTFRVSIYKEGETFTQDPSSYQIEVTPLPRQWVFTDRDSNFSALRREQDCVDLMLELIQEDHCPARCRYSLRDSRNKNIQGGGNKVQRGISQCGVTLEFIKSLFLGAQQGFSSQMAAQDDLEDGGSCGLLSSQAESGSLDMMLEDFKIALLDSEHAHLWAIEVYLKADEGGYDFDRFPGHIFTVYRHSRERYYVFGSFVGQYSLYDWQIGESPPPYYRGPFTHERAVEFFDDLSFLLYSNEWDDDVQEAFDRTFGTQNYQLKQPQRKLVWQFVLWSGKALRVCGATTPLGKPYVLDTCAFCQCCRGELFALGMYSYMNLPTAGGVFSFHQ